MKARKITQLLRIAVLPAAAAAATSIALPAIAADNVSTQGSANKVASDRQESNKSSSTGNKQSTAYRAMRASQIIGKEVRNPQGNDVGHIRDLVINMNTGQVRYAMLEFDPGLFQGERLFAVPTSELWTGSNDQLVYNMTRDRLESVGVPRTSWASRWRDSLSNADRASASSSVTQPSDNARSYRASDLIGKDVNSRSGEDIGDLKDLVINLANQKVHYAVLAFDPSWTTPEKNYAFPLSSFRLSQDKDELVADIDKSRIQSMRGFDDDRYSNLNDRNWIVVVDRYIATTNRDASTAQRDGSSMNSAGTGGAPSGSSPASEFARLDRNSNGTLDKAEMDQEWTRLDADKNGRVTRDEFNKARDPSGTGTAQTTSMRR